jgi:hypothetical protein
MVRDYHASWREGLGNDGGEVSIRGRSDVVLVPADRVIDESLAQLLE